MKKLFFLILLASSVCRSQNLVINPSLDSYTDYKGTINNRMNWSSSNDGSIDYYEVDTNLYGSPNHGKSYQGFIVVRNTNGRIQHLREYVQGELKTNLEKGEKYFVQFNVRLKSLKGGATSSIGLGFYNRQKDNHWWRGRVSIRNKFIVKNKKENIIKSKEWVKVEGVYIASGNEKYFGIGNFNLKMNTICEKEKYSTWSFYKPDYMKRNGDGYYFLDDVTVTPIPKDYLNTRDDSTKFINNKFISNSPKLNESFKLENIQFEKGKSYLTNESELKLKEIYHYLMVNPFLTFELNLHLESNYQIALIRRLREHRVNFIYDYLGGMGISKNRIYINQIIKSTNDSEVNYVEFKFLENKISDISKENFN